MITFLFTIILIHIYINQLAGISQGTVHTQNFAYGYSLHQAQGYAQLSIKFIVLINVKMPTIVGNLTLISTINTTSEGLKARKVFIFQHFSFY